MHSHWSRWVLLLMATVTHGYQECKWEGPDQLCSVTYPETFCKYNKTTGLGLTESQCKTAIGRGEPCCMGGSDDYYGYRCLNTSYNGKYNDKFNRCFSLVKQCHRPHYIPHDEPCKIYNGDVLDNRYVYSELQCIDTCMRDWRCTAYNMKQADGGIDCQLLGRLNDLVSECKKGYTGQLLDRAAFYTAYLSNQECS